MGGARFAILVLILISVNNSSTQLLKSKIKQNQNIQRTTNVSTSSNRRNIASSDYSFSTNAVHQLHAGDNLVSLPEFNEYGKKEVHENVKAIIVTKRVPVPYTVHVEKKVPYPVRVPVRRPFTVYVPKPYVVELPKPYPFAIKVPMPQPYTVEKHIPFPVKIPIDKPYPVHIPKPYPVFVEKKVPVHIEKHIPFQIKIPVERPIPIHIPVERPVPYPVEKAIPFPVKIPVERPIPVAIEKPIPISIEHVIEKPQTTDQVPESNIVSSENFGKIKTSASNFHPSTFDPVTSSLLQGNNKAISFLPGSTQETYSLGTIHVPDTSQSQGWNVSTTDWIPKQQYIYTKPQKVAQVLPKNLNTYKYVYPDRLASTINLENIAPLGEAPALKETHGIQYEPVKYEAYKQEIAKSSQQNNLPLQQQQQQQQQETINSYQTSTIIKSNPTGSKPILNSNYQFFNIHPQYTAAQEIKQKENIPETSISFQKFEAIQPSHGETKWIPHTLVYNSKPHVQYLTTQQEKLQYEEIPQYTYQISHLLQPDSAEQKYQGQYQAAQPINYIPTAQALFMAHPTYQQETFQSNTKPDQQLQHSTLHYHREKPVEHFTTDMKQQQHYSQPVIYEQTIRYHYGDSEPITTVQMPQTNSHTGIVEQTTLAQQTTLPATIQQLDTTTTTQLAQQNNSYNLVQQSNSTTEVTKKYDENINNNYENLQKHNFINNIENTPITYSDITRNFIRKTRRKSVGKRKHPLRDTIQPTVKIN